MERCEHDTAIYEAILLEKNRQETHIELIASENFVTKAVMEAQGSILTNKYAEGYPGKRYYGGCQHVDTIEDIARDRIKEIFGAKYANVQPHSGSQANMGVYRAILEAGDTVLGMNLSHGGHLTHGHPLNFTGKDYNFIEYKVTDEDNIIDYDEVMALAIEHKPRLIIAGASAYPREIDFKKFKKAAEVSGALLMVDMAHIAGLVAAGLHMNPVEYADVVTSTTHKTLRGPRGGIILTNDEEIAKKIDRAIFPGIQGGPLMHVIAAKAVAFKEAQCDDFVDYQKQVIKNAKALAEALKAKGLKIVSGGTDNHLLLVDVKSSLGITGKLAEETLDKVSITCNKNTIPFDTEKPFITSGIRIGTPAVTTRGFIEEDMKEIAECIYLALTNIDNEEILSEVQNRVSKLTEKYPLYK